MAVYLLPAYAGFMSARRTDQEDESPYTDTVVGWSRRHTVTLAVFITIDLILLVLWLAIGGE